jgi:tetraacyldisaccharide 4'-kinase
MNFNAPLLKPIRILLFPVSIIYAFIIWIRNRLYDRNVLQGTSFNLPVICVGNLSVGGTGKSTMVEYLLRILQHRFKTGTMSRGYKRKTKGYALASERTTALEIGDEPMQFHNKFPAVSVAVGEERIVAIPQLLQDRPDTQVIILDDAFQHRKIKAGLNILLTEYNNLFTRDWYLPTGDLRDEAGSYERANILIVTKCPEDLLPNERDEIKKEINPLTEQELFFTSIEYGEPFHITRKHKVHIDGHMEVLLVSGIANPRPLKKYLQDNTKVYYEMLYNDHHIFTIDDWKDIAKRFHSIQAFSKIILTTEKDAVRLIKFDQELKDLPVFVVPIETKFLNGEEKRFDDLIIKFIKEFHKTS